MNLKRITARIMALIVFVIALKMALVKGLQLYGRHRQEQRRAALGPQGRPVPPAMPNDAIEKSARKLAGSRAKDCGRSLIRGAIAEYDPMVERWGVNSCALGSFQARQPFIMIRDDENSSDGINFQRGITHRDAFVLSPQGQLWRLSTSATASGEKPIVKQKIKRLIVSKITDGGSVTEIRYQ